jgi:phospholipid/cholesterol/gamma-HCH transport system ATP-binding protein
MMISTAEDPGGAVDAAAELRDFVKMYSGKRVLDGAGMSLAAGQMHALVGPGGSGKTLLLLALGTLLPPDSGEVLLFGAPVPFDQPEGLREVRARIGVQFQNLALFDFLTVRENVAFPLDADASGTPPEEVDRRVRGILEDVRLPGAIDLDIQSLSGGMQRRVAVARAAVSNAELLLFDDPSGGLDPVTTSRIFALIEGIHARRRCTVVIASHDIDRLARVCSVFHVVDEGRVIFSGPLDEGLTHPDARVRTFLEVTDART